MKFKSKYELTISFTQESFAKLLDKDWEVLECHMSDGKTVAVPRWTVTTLWSSTKEWRKVPHSSTKVKVLKVA